MMLNDTMSNFNSSDAIGCQLSCYRNPTMYCNDQGVEISPRFQCVPCSNICPRPGHDVDISLVSFTCLDKCLTYLQLPPEGFFEKYQDRVMLTLCVVVSVLVIVVFLQLLIKFIKSRLKRKDQRDIEVSHETGTDAVSTNGMKITNNVTVNNGYAPKMEDETHRGSSESVALLGNGRVNMEQTDTAHDPVEETLPFSSSPCTAHGLPESDTKAAGHVKSTDAQTTME